MLFRLKDVHTSVVRPRVTPDPEAAAQLERRISELTYHPENGFHRDHQQRRRARFQWRLALQR
jgi:hypothetical protein